MEDVVEQVCDRKFEVHCNAGEAGELRVPTGSLSVKIGQLVRIRDEEEMWHSVVIHCEETEDGFLTVKVMICHFEWDETRQIALIKSKSNQKTRSGVFTVDLEQKDV